MDDTLCLSVFSPFLVFLQSSQAQEVTGGDLLVDDELSDVAALNPLMNAARGAGKQAREREREREPQVAREEGEKDAVSFRNGAESVGGPFERGDGKSRPQGNI